MPTVELPKEIADQLEKIKRSEFLSGKGYVSTIAFLIHHYEETKRIEDILNHRLSSLENTLTKELRAIFKAERKRVVEETMRQFFMRIFSFQEEERQVLITSNEFDENDFEEEEEEDHEDYEDLELSED